MKLFLQHLITGLLLCLGGYSFLNGSDTKPVFSSLVTFGDTAVVSIELKQPGGELERKWLEVGERIGDWTLEAIELEASPSVRMLKEDGSVLVLHPRQGTIAPSHPDAFDPDWINSDANPMLNNAIALPDDVRNNWLSLSEEERAGIIQMYRNHGYDASFEPPSAPHEPFRERYRPLFPEERRQRLIAIREAFEDSLSLDQLAAYREIQNTRPPGTESPAPGIVAMQQTAGDEEFRAQVRRDFREWLLSLSEEQMRLYYRMARDPNP
ncbi:MAG: hypothetical protein EA425_15515 [Puniceicoccaceae bacterium]|nr:MAG: hypothetical protein EA425_15515 [Puniceicoccaceae bacterium]